MSMKGEVRGHAFHADVIYWRYAHAMKLLQGVQLQHLFGPNYLYFRGKPAPVYASRPCLRDACFASIRQVPKDLGLFELVHLLHTRS